MADKADEFQRNQAPPPYHPGPSNNDAPPSGYYPTPYPQLQYQGHPQPQYQGQPQPQYQGQPQPIYTQPGPTIIPSAQSVTVVQPVPPGTYVQNYHTTQFGTPVVVVSSILGNNPSTVNCRSCNHQMVTRVEYSAGARTHFSAFFLCILGCWPCALLPYCVNDCQNADHYCTNCGAYIGASRF